MYEKKTSARRLVERAAELPLHADGSLVLAIVADTHGKPHPDALGRLAALTPDAILHGGDIGELSVLDELASVAPVIAVRGNIDERASEVPDVVRLAITADGAPALTLLLLHIAVYGAKLRADARKLALSAGAKLVVCGHSHVPFIGRDAGLTLFNPGSIGPRRMHLPIVFGVLRIAQGKLSLKHVSCETGEEWLP